MLHRTPHHRTEASTVWLLSRMVQGNREIVALQSSADGGEHTASRLIAKECGLQVINRLPPWVTKANGRELVYRRDNHIFWFQLQAWPVDGEAV